MRGISIAKKLAKRKFYLTHSANVIAHSLLCCNAPIHQPAISWINAISWIPSRKSIQNGNALVYVERRFGTRRMFHHSFNNNVMETYWQHFLIGLYTNPSPSRRNPNRTLLLRFPSTLGPSSDLEAKFQKSWLKSSQSMDAVAALSNAFATLAVLRILNLLPFTHHGAPFMTIPLVGVLCTAMHTLLAAWCYMATSAMYTSNRPKVMLFRRVWLASAQLYMLYLAGLDLHTHDNNDDDDQHGIVTCPLLQMLLITGIHGGGISTVLLNIPWSQHVPLTMVYVFMFTRVCFVSSGLCEQVGRIREAMECGHVIEMLRVVAGYMHGPTWATQVCCILASIHTVLVCWSCVGDDDHSACCMMCMWQSCTT